jgi:hypothetical protein
MPFREGRLMARSRFPSSFGDSLESRWSPASSSWPCPRSGTAASGISLVAHTREYSGRPRPLRPAENRGQHP